jgi:hypothetical protein
MEKTDNYSGLTSSQFAPDLALNNFIASGNLFPTQPSAIVSNGLVLYLDAGIGNSYPQAGTTWFDLSNRRNNGTLSQTTANGVLYSSLYGGSLRFNGTTSPIGGGWIQCPLVMSNNSSFTISAWFMTFNRSQSGQLICHNGTDSGGNGFGFAVNNESTTNGELLLLYAAVAWVNTGFIVSSNIMYNVVVVVESDRSSKTYVNGNLSFTGATNNLITPTTHTQIGRNDFASFRFFNGLIPQVLIYNRVLSAAEVAQNFNAQRTRFGL